MKRFLAMAIISLLLLTGCNNVDGWVVETAHNKCKGSVSSINNYGGTWRARCMDGSVIDLDGEE